MNYLNQQKMKALSSMCLATEAEEKGFISKNSILYNDNINQNIKFTIGKCNPIVLIPGIYNTRLKVRINCKELRRDEESLYSKIKLYFNKYVCSSNNDQEEYIIKIIYSAPS